jgi:capsular exopolysaccharide synthesis family protein
MERIQQALSKAEEKRREIAEGAGRKGSGSGGKDPAEQADHSSIEYSDTKTVSVSSKIMRENRLIAGIKGDPYSDIFRVLRTKVLYAMRNAGINTLAITSPSKGCGKSMVAANLAVSLSLEVNHTVLLVDLDLRNPSVHKYFGIKPEHSLAEHISGDKEFSSLLLHPGIERLVLLPSAKPVQHASELISTPKMADLMDDITNRYTSRIIIFDLPPLLHIDDALIFLPNVQSSLLVVEEGVSTPAEVRESLRLLESSNLLGTVYNKAREHKHSPY